METGFRIQFDRRTRLYIVGGIFWFVLAILLFATRDVFLKVFNLSRMGYLAIGLAPALCALLGVMYFLMVYLVPRRSIEVGDVSFDTTTPISEAQNPPVDDGTEPTIGDGKGIATSTKGPVAQDLAEFAVLSDPFDGREQRILKLFGDTQRRLRNEIDALGNRANLNLVFGVGITIIGVVVLIYLITRSHPDFPNVAGVLSHYIPRLSTVALIEAFAYFFLNLYKSNLAEIKYYQNERTSATAMQIAWIASSGDEKSRTEAYVIRKLASIDRNASLAIAESNRPGELDISKVLEILTKVAAKTGKSDKDKE